MPYLFRDITFSVCSALPSAALGHEATSVSELLPSQPLPRCATFTAFYGLFHALPLLCNHVRILTLQVASCTIHWTKHCPAEERDFDPYESVAPTDLLFMDDFTVKPVPQELFSILTLFPNLRCLMLYDFLLDLSQLNGPFETIFPKLELLSICFPYRSLSLSRDPNPSLHDPSKDQSVKFLLQCFGEVGTLHLKGYDPGLTPRYNPNIDEQYAWRKARVDSRLRIPLQISELIIQESNIQSTFFSDNIFVSPSVHTLRHLDMSSRQRSGKANLQAVLRTVGHHLESFRFNTLDFLSPHSEPILVTSFAIRHLSKSRFS